MISKLFALVFFAGLGFSAAFSIVRRQSITPLSSAQISAFKPYTNYAAAAYCDPSITLKWTCGAACKANPTFIPTASGGDGAAIQFWFVGFDPSLNSVIVGHQGTNTSQILADLTDINLLLQNLDANLFPGLSSSILVHSGFADEQARTALPILVAVQATMSAHKTNTIHVVGHSLGAAIALLDSIYFPLHIPGVKVIFTGYGLLRVGNQNFANYVDASGISFTRVNNRKDPFPILPSLGYVHPSNEIHISENTFWESCPGQENPSYLCSDGDVPNTLVANISDHAGPYDGVFLGTCLP